MPSVGVIHGGGLGVYEESERALDLVRSCGLDPVMIALNEAGISLPVLDHWGTLHPNKFGLWCEQRKALGLSGDYLRWGLSQTHRVDHVVRNWRGGSSGLHGADIALNGLGLPAAILCGVPMDDRPNQFRGTPWGQCKSFHAGWQRREALPTLRLRVRSMSGPHPKTGLPAWTVTLLGAPDRAWLEGLLDMAA